MLRKNKKMALGITLFSSAILMGISTTQVKADTTSTPENMEQQSVSANDPVTNEEKSNENVVNDAQNQTDEGPMNESSIQEDSSKTGLSNNDSESSSVPSNQNITSDQLDSNSTDVTDTTVPDVNVQNDDDQAINFEDPTLANSVKTSLGLNNSDDLTVNTIKNYSKSNSLNISAGSDNQSVTSLDGLQYLSNLSTNVLINLNVNFGNNNVDLNTLKDLKYSWLTLTGNLRNEDVSPLTQIDTSGIYNIDLSGNGKYQQTQNGLTNAQLVTLGDWLTKIYNNSVQAPLGGKTINLNRGSITDFTPLSGVDKNINGMIVSIGNMNVDGNTVNVVQNQKTIFDTSTVKDLDGNKINASYGEILNSLKDGKDAPFINLGDGKYEIPSTYIVANNPLLMYGYEGFLVNSNRMGESYYYKAYNEDNPSSALEFKYDAMNYRRVNLQSSASITFNFYNALGRQLAKSVTLSGGNVDQQIDMTGDQHFDIEGYTLTNPEVLKVTFSQDPQTINLIYRSNPNIETGGLPIEGQPDEPTINPDTNPVTPSNPVVKDDSRNIFDKDQYIATFFDRASVPVYDVDGNKIAGRTLDAATDWFSDKVLELNGKTYYRVSTDEWVNSSDVYIYVPRNGYVRAYHDSSKNLVTADDIQTGRVVDPSSNWKFDRTVQINNKMYYRVSTNEFISVDDAFEYEPDYTFVSALDNVVVYDENGQATDRILSTYSNWKVNKISMINGVKMYHVSTNEWVKVSDVLEYTPINKTIETTDQTLIYDENGQLVSRKLSKNTFWKTDKIALINGNKMYRVSTNEWIKADEVKL